MSKYKVALKDLENITYDIRNPKKGEPYSIFNDTDGRTMFRLYAVPTDSGFQYVLGSADRWQHNPKYSIEGNQRHDALRNIKDENFVSKESAAKMLQSSRERPLGERAMDMLKESWERIFD